MKENYAENNKEKIPGKEEILELISYFAERTIPIRELSDEKGLYLLEVKTETDQAGEHTTYEYIRKGRFANMTIQESVTSIAATYYMNDSVVSGETIAVYDERTGAWEKTGNSYK